MKLTLPYHQVQDVICSEPSSISAAEAHGVLTGMLCVCGDLKLAQWLAALFDSRESGVAEADMPTLSQLCEQTRRALRQNDYAFELLLPDEETELRLRAAALGEWCQGFLYGVGLQGAPGEWTQDTAEVLSDLAEISRLDSDVEGEADEAAFTEINEFVRIAVQMVLEEFQYVDPSTRLH